MGDIERVQRANNAPGIGKAPIRVEYNPNRRHRHPGRPFDEPADTIEVGDEDAALASIEPIDTSSSPGLDLEA